MLSERILSRLIHTMTKQHLALNPTSETMMPSANPGQKYMLYMHVPFCERLCPYCSFNRYPFREEVARPYFANMRKEMLMLKDLGYDFESIYVGGGTPTVMIDELCETLDMARDNFNIREVASETNPNHLTQPWLDKLQGRVQRLSVGVQSFDDDLLKQMDRYEKYGSGGRHPGAHRRGGAVLRLAERGHDLQFPLADRGRSHGRPREDRAVRLPPDHVLLRCTCRRPLRAKWPLR